MENVTDLFVNDADGSTTMSYGYDASGNRLQMKLILKGPPDGGNGRSGMHQMVKPAASGRGLGKTHVRSVAGNRETRVATRQPARLAQT